MKVARFLATLVGHLAIGEIIDVSGRSPLHGLANDWPDQSVG